MSRLFVRIAGEAETVQDGEQEVAVLRDLEWVLLDEAGALVSSGTGDGRALAGLLGAGASQEPDNVVAIVPTELCLWVQCSVPGRTVGQIRRAIPFVVEEFLAGDVESMHLAHGTIRRGQVVDCIAVDRSHMRGWLDGLQRIGLSPGHVVSAGAILPTRADGITVLFDGRTTLLRTPRQSLSVDADQIVYTLSAAVAELAPTASGETAASPTAKLEPFELKTINGTIAALDRSQIEQNAPRSIRWVEEETDLTTLAYLARTWRSSNATIDLLQGPFAPPRRRSMAWQRWRAVAAFAGAWVLLALVAETGKGWWAGSSADALTEETTALYREYFPEDQRIQNVRRQMAQHLGDAGSEGPGFLKLVGQFGKALVAQPGAELLSLGFTDGRSELAADLTVPGYDALDALKTSLSAMGLGTDISSAEQQESRVRARLKIKAT